MRKIKIICLILIAVLALTACGGPTWQEKYDLGMRYLGEGNYEEAIIAFNAAIKIDPKQALAYIGLSDAYLGEGNLEEAREILERALGLVDERTIIEDKILDLNNILVEDMNDSGINSSGGTIFSSRECFIAYSDLSINEQQFISDVADAVINGDRDSLLSVALLGDSILEKHVGARTLGDICLYTYWNGYKVGLGIHNMGNFQDDAFSESYWSIELRPENGMGYYASVLDAALKDGYNLPASAFYISMQKIIITQCNSSDWKWNGVYSMEETMYGKQYIDGEYRDILSGSNTVGEMKNSLRHGTFYENGYTTHDYPNKEDWTNEYAGEAVFQDGLCIDDGGLHYLSGHTRYTIDGAGYGYDLTDQPFMDLLYW